MPKVVTRRPLTFEAEQVKLPTNGKVGDLVPIVFSTGTINFPVVRLGDGQLGLEVQDGLGGAMIATLNYWIVYDPRERTFGVFDNALYNSMYA